MIAKLNALRARFNKAIAPIILVLAQPGVLALFHGRALVLAELVVTAAGAVGVIAAPKNADAAPAA